MAYLFIEEFASMSDGGNGKILQAGRQPAIAVQRLEYTGTAAASSAFNVATRFVRIHTDSVCSYAFGTAPVATASYPRMAADSTEYFGVPVGQSFKVSAITNT